MAEKLMKEVNRRTLQVLFVDYQMVKEFYEKKGFDLKDLEKSKGLLYLNEVFGAHALVAGELSGPYVFTTKTTKEQEATASAIIKIDMRLMDTLTGKTLKNLSANNPIIAAKEKGSFSEEKAKIKAIDVTLANLGRSLAKELDGMDWFCRIAKVEGEAGLPERREINGPSGGRCDGSVSARRIRRTRRGKGQDSNFGLLWNRCLHGQADPREKPRCR